MKTTLRQPTVRTIKYLGKIIYSPWLPLLRRFRGSISLKTVLSYGVGKLSNVGKTLSKTYGKGLLDKYLESATGNAISRFAQTRGGTAVLAALGEGTEEMIESALSPLFKKITFDPNARWNAEEILYDGLVGGILGGIAGGVGGVDTKQNKSEAPAAGTAQESGVQNTAQDGVQAPQSNSNVEQVKFYPQKHKRK